MEVGATAVVKAAVATAAAMEAVKGVEEMAVAAAVARMEVTERPAAGRSGLVRVAWARRGRGEGGGGGGRLLSWIYYWSRPCARSDFHDQTLAPSAGTYSTRNTRHTFYPSIPTPSTQLHRTVTAPLLPAG